MNLRTISILIFLLPSSLPVYASSQADSCSIYSTSTIIQIRNNLQQFSESEANPEYQDCLAGSLDKMASIKSETDIPLLIKFLTFERPLEPSAKLGFTLHARIPSYRYPAIGALMAQGKAAESFLIKEIEAKETGSLAMKNAVTVLLLVDADHPEFAILALKRSQNSLHGDGSVKRNAAIKYALDSYRCKESKGSCEKAAKLVQ